MKVGFSAKVIRIGHSFGMRIPKKYLDVAQVKENDLLDVVFDLQYKKFVVKKTKEIDISKDVRKARIRKIKG